MLKKKVLLVEDEVISASALKMGLEDLGFYVCPLATRGDHAIAIALEEKPDVILMDVNLPGVLDGIQTAKKILESLETNILFLTGYHDDDVITRIMALNPMGYIVKPISAERIKEVLDDKLQQ